MSSKWGERSAAVIPILRDERRSTVVVKLRGAANTANRSSRKGGLGNGWYDRGDRQWFLEYVAIGVCGGWWAPPLSTITPLQASTLPSPRNLQWALPPPLMIGTSDSASKRSDKGWESKENNPDDGEERRRNTYNDGDDDNDHRAGRSGDPFYFLPPSALSVKTTLAIYSALINGHCRPANAMRG